VEGPDEGGGVSDVIEQERPVEALAGIYVWCAKFEHVGSRVTCNPPPADTDEDILCLINPDNYGRFLAAIKHYDWQRGGSDIPVDANTVPVEDRFVPYRLDDINLITTTSPTFYKRFMAATHCAKRFNLLSKDDRIALFQAVLYGKVWEMTPEPMLPTDDEPF
jgi:hypothetical protein